MRSSSPARASGSIGRSRVALLAATTLALALGATTWWALEAGGVAVVETRTPGGSVRSTHVWYVEPAGELWVEAGSPRNDWFEDLRHDPILIFTADGHSARYRARPVADPSVRRRIRALILKKYGLRDRWVGLFVDASRSVPVQLSPAPR